MRFALLTFALSALTYVAAAPVDSDVLIKARKLYARHFPASNTLAKRQSQNITDTDILNFALQLEYLEAQYYSIASSGQELDASLLNGTGTQGCVEGGGGQVPFSNPLIQQYANEIAADELNHVKDLRAALGCDAVAQPKINLNDSFTAAAQAAGIITAGQTFDPFSSDDYFLLGAFLFEDVGVTAYNGAAPLITSKAYLAAAASILAVEAYHAGAIRATLIAAALNNSMISTAANLAATAEGSLDDGKSVNITTPNGDAQVVADNEQSLANARTPGEVLDIVFLTGQAGATMGGFFPDGLNGNLNVAAGAGN